MSIESTLDHAPPWNKWIAKELEPFGVFVDVGLLAIAVICIWAVFKWNNHGIKALLLAFIVSP